MLRINVRHVLPLSDHEDKGIDGVYEVHFTEDVSRHPKQKQASIALDVFHGSVPVGMLDEFKFTVVDENDRAIDQDPNHEDYSGEKAGYIKRTSQDPIYVVGEDDSLTADELDSKYNPDGDGEHPRYPRANWRHEVENENTLRGYWDWVEAQIGEESDAVAKNIIESRPTATLVSSEHNFDDYDVTGAGDVHRICVPHSIKKGEIFNVYCANGAKRGSVWQGTLEKSLANLIADARPTAADQPQPLPSEEEASNGSETEFAFDVTLNAALRVTALSEKRAKAKLLEALTCANTNFGEWPDGSPILGEASIAGEPSLFEVNGVPYQGTSTHQ